MKYSSKVSPGDEDAFRCISQNLKQASADKIAINDWELLNYKVDRHEGSDLCTGCVSLPLCLFSFFFFYSAIPANKSTSTFWDLAIKWNF